MNRLDKIYISIIGISTTCGIFTGLREYPITFKNVLFNTSVGLTIGIMAPITIPAIIYEEIHDR